MLKRKKASIKFVGRKQSIYGLISTIIGGVGVVTLGVLFYIATKAKGMASLWMGLVGILLLGLSIAGFIVGTRGLKQKDVFYGLPIVGTASNGVLLIGMVVLYFLGLIY